MSSKKRILSLPDSDIAKPAGRKPEALSEIRAGSTGEITKGYLTIEAVVLPDSRNSSLSLEIYG